LSRLRLITLRRSSIFKGNFGECICAPPGAEN
jgi:hypothetical protein